jgi:hypothetical protein
MQCTIEEAFSLFLEPWRASDAELLVALDRGGGVRCRIVETSPGEGLVTIHASEWGGKQRVVDLSSAKLSYEDARAGLIPELVERKWEVFLLAEFPNGRSLLLALPRNDVDSTTPVH